jgi:hypothetical protein
MPGEPLGGIAVHGVVWACTAWSGTRAGWTVAQALGPVSVGGAAETAAVGHGRPARARRSARTAAGRRRSRDAATDPAPPNRLRGQRAMPVSQSRRPTLRARRTKAYNRWPGGCGDPSKYVYSASDGQAPRPRDSHSPAAGMPGPCRPAPGAARRGALPSPRTRQLVTCHPLCAALRDGNPRLRREESEYIRADTGCLPPAGAGLCDGREERAICP